MLVEIDRYLRHNNMSETRFGRLSVNDPRLVGDLKRGRQLRPETVARVAAFLSACGA